MWQSVVDYWHRPVTYGGLVKFYLIGTTIQIVWALFKEFHKSRQWRFK